ncbi:MAG TPA: hypothetical protein VM686_35325 [Polyangiaceae bacterium]|nr:hypothetical protein [Polyangiaceae bacterium]
MTDRVRASTTKLAPLAPGASQKVNIRPSAVVWATEWPSGGRALSRNGADTKHC